MNSLNILSFDTETSGLNPRESFIISLGVVMYNHVNKNQEEFYCLIDWSKIFPNFWIGNDTIKVHGLTNEYVKANGLNPNDAMKKFVEFISNAESSNGNIEYINGFNLGFDINMMIANLLCLHGYNTANSIDNQYVEFLLDLFRTRRNESVLPIDSMLFDIIYHFEINGQKVKHNLSDVGLRYNIKEDEHAHNSLADTKRTVEILKHQLDECNDLGCEFNNEFVRRQINSYNIRQKMFARYGKAGNDMDFLGETMVATTSK